MHLGELILAHSTPMVIAAATIHKDAKTQARRPAMHAEIIAVQIKHGYPLGIYSGFHYLSGMVAKQIRLR